MRARKKFTFSGCVTDTAFKVIKCKSVHDAKTLELLEGQALPLPANADEKKLSDLWQQSLKKMGYDHHPIIVCLPRNQATCRYLKVPAVTPSEIEKMSNLQASRYLPYPAHELVTAFDIISTDKEGYAHINLTIVQKNNIERILNILKGFKASRMSIILSSYALLNLYLFLKPGDHESTMIIDVDALQAELAVVGSRKLLFSRSVKMDRQAFGWKNVLFDEMDKTLETYMESVSSEPIRKFALVGTRSALDELKEALEAKFSLPAEILTLGPNLNIPPNLSGVILNSEVSFASCLGLCLKEPQPSLNLLPQDIKDETRKVISRKKSLQAAVLALVIMMAWGIGSAKHLDNREVYLERLRSELAKISKTAKPLEDIERRFELLEARNLNVSSSLDILHELHAIVPADAALISMSFEENKQVLLRGQSPGLDSVFAFVDRIEKSSVFKPFRIKVRYATKKKTASGDMVDFEIECLKK
ncbi:MAG: pilus assembly protein PilM [Candidatus Omnitrophota bacterium]